MRKVALVILAAVNGDENALAAVVKVVEERVGAVDAQVTVFLV